MSDTFKFGAVAASLAALANYLVTSLPELLAWLVPLAYRVAPQVSWLPTGAIQKAVFAVSIALVVWFGARWLGGAIESIR